MTIRNPASAANPAERDGEATTIRRARPDDRPHLLGIWLRSVRATHSFLTPEDIAELTQPTSEYLCSNENLWILADARDAPIGFMGLADGEVDSLFLAPEIHGRGNGRWLIEHAAALQGELTVEVNEQNVGAVRFYVACGFTTERRSDVDDEGRPFPILYMRRQSGALDEIDVLRGG